MFRSDLGNDRWMFVFASVSMKGGGQGPARPVNHVQRKLYSVSVTWSAEHRLFPIGRQVDQVMRYSGRFNADAFSIGP
jgi:hypothetical protein